MTLVFDIVAQKLIIIIKYLAIRNLWFYLIMTELEHYLGQEIITLEICELTSLTLRKKMLHTLCKK